MINCTIMTIYNQTKEVVQDDVAVLLDELSDSRLILWNDDVNTFDWVIESLVKVCQHQQEQAEQCAYIVHYNGKCDVKKGTFEKLRPMCEALIDRGINATIE